MKRLSFLLPFLLFGCGVQYGYEKPTIRKFSVTYWLSSLDESYAQRAFQIYKLVEHDKEKYIFLVNGRWADTFYVDGTKVSAVIHSLNPYKDDIFQFNGELTDPSYKNLKIEGIVHSITVPTEEDVNIIIE